MLTLRGFKPTEDLRTGMLALRGFVGPVVEELRNGREEVFLVPAERPQGLPFRLIAEPERPGGGLSSGDAHPARV